MRKLRNYLILVLLAGPVVLLDQAAKYLVRTYLDRGEIWMPIEALRPYVHIVHWTNTGAAFGMFQEGGILFAILAIVVSAGIIYYYRDSDAVSWPVRVALGLQLGGALGNLIDRILFGLTVTDFMWFSFFPAVSNVADWAITAGVGLLLLDLILEARKRKVESAADAGPAPEPPSNAAAGA